MSCVINLLTLIVILSEAKNLAFQMRETLHFVQGDTEKNSFSALLM
jgi:hypothetical protein